MCALEGVKNNFLSANPPDSPVPCVAAFSAKDEDGDTVHNQPLLLSIYAQRRERERDAAVLPLRNTE